MFRVVKESETVDSRQHCFLLQSSGHEPRYLSVETRQELLRIENSWNAAIVTSVIKLGVSEMKKRWFGTGDIKYSIWLSEIEWAVEKNK